MTLKEKLNQIQVNLKAPKNQRNNFGNYNYRSCEDILEALKPLLKETKTILTLSDEMFNIDSRFYVKATAILSDCETTETITTCAVAREAEMKKGMDESQITGASSSYARKYALNGLFLIDDTKDADATNTHEKETKGKVIDDAPRPVVKVCPICKKEHTGRYEKCIDCWKQNKDVVKTKKVVNPDVEPF